MHPYIKHLIEDIQNAERQENDPVDFPEPITFEEQMQEAERYISGEGERKLSELTGLGKENFPPAHQLTDKEMEMVLTAYDAMLFTWNTEVNWPHDMPIASRYNFLLNFVLSKKKNVPMSTGTIHLDFCAGYALDCIWEQFYNCTEFYDEKEPT